MFSDVIVTIEYQDLRGINESFKEKWGNCGPFGNAYLDVSLHPVVDPRTDEVLVKAGEQITEAIVKRIENAPVDAVEVRSPLTCEASVFV